MCVECVECVSRSAVNATFADGHKLCMPVRQRCYEYNVNTCFRTVTKDRMDKIQTNSTLTTAMIDP